MMNPIIPLTPQEYPAAAIEAAVEMSAVAAVTPP